MSPNRKTRSSAHGKRKATSPTTTTLVVSDLVEAVASRIGDVRQKAVERSDAAWEQVQTEGDAEQRRAATAVAKEIARTTERRVRVLHAVVGLLNELSGDAAALERADVAAVRVLKALKVPDLYGVSDRRVRTAALKALKRAMGRAILEQATSTADLESLHALGAKERALRAKLAAAGSSTVASIARIKTELAKTAAKFKELHAELSNLALTTAHEALRIEADSITPAELTRGSPLSHRLAFALLHSGLADDAVIAMLGNVPESALDSMATGLREAAKKHRRPTVEHLCLGAIGATGVLSAQQRTELFDRDK